MNLTTVGDTDLAPLGVLEGAELDEHVFVDAIGGRPVAWMLFSRHRITCPGSVDPALCCAPNGDPDGWHAYEADEDTPGAVPVTPVRPQ